MEKKGGFLENEIKRKRLAPIDTKKIQNKERKRKKMKKKKKREEIKEKFLPLNFPTEQTFCIIIYYNILL